MGMTYKVVSVKLTTKDVLESVHYTDEELDNFDKDGFHEPLFYHYTDTIPMACTASKLFHLLGIPIPVYQIEAYDDGCEEPFAVATINFNNVGD